jgi:hypothetical protein
MTGGDDSSLSPAAGCSDGTGAVLEYLAYGVVALLALAVCRAIAGSISRRIYGLTLRGARVAVLCSGSARLAQSAAGLLTSRGAKVAIIDLEDAPSFEEAAIIDLEGGSTAGFALVCIAPGGSKGSLGNTLDAARRLSLAAETLLRRGTVRRLLLVLSRAAVCPLGGRGAAELELCAAHRMLQGLGEALGAGACPGGAAVGTPAPSVQELVLAHTELPAEEESDDACSSSRRRRGGDSLSLSPKRAAAAVAGVLASGVTRACRPASLGLLLSLRRAGAPRLARWLLGFLLPAAGAGGAGAKDKSE